MVARKWVRLADAIAAELGGTSEMRSLSQAPDDVLLRASDRSRLLLATQFYRPEDRLAAIRRRLDEVRDARHFPASLCGEDEGSTIRSRLREIAFRDTTNMSPTDRRTTAEALRTLVGLDRASRRRADREKCETEIVKRPAEFEGDPVMIARSILPAGPTPRELAERETLAERSRPARTSEERLRQQAFAQQAQIQAQFEREIQRSLATAAYYRAWAARHPVQDAPRRIGMPGLGGM